MGELCQPHQAARRPRACRAGAGTDRGAAGAARTNGRGSYGPRELAPLAIGTHPGGVDSATWHRFRTGKLPAARTLDLHGHTAQRAFHSLATFLRVAHAEGLRCVEVVTGQGGVLRREVPLWLNLPELRGVVLAAAHPHAPTPARCDCCCGARDDGRIRSGHDVGASLRCANPMTPFGARLRALRAERGVTLQHLARELQVSAAYLSALEHGRRGAPSAGLVHQVNEFFGLIWDDAEELARLARLSHPRVTVNTAGLTPEQTALANRLAQTIHRLSPETVAAMHALLDTRRRS